MYYLLDKNYKSVYNFFVMFDSFFIIQDDGFTRRDLNRLKLCVEFVLANGELDDDERFEFQNLRKKILEELDRTFD